MLFRSVNEFSNDGSLAGNSDLAVPTEKAVKTYADTKGDMNDVVDDTTPTLGGDLVCADNDITGIRTAGFTGVGAAGSKTASFNVDFDIDQDISVTLTANTMTMTLQTPLNSDSTHKIKIINGGLATLTWAAESGTVTHAGGVPTLTSSGTDVVACWWDGTNWVIDTSLNFS